MLHTKATFQFHTSPTHSPAQPALCRSNSCFRTHSRPPQVGGPECRLDLETLHDGGEQAMPAHRRLQGQEHAADRRQGRSRPAGRVVSGRTLAGSRPGARVLLRTDRQAPARGASASAPRSSPPPGHRAAAEVCCARIAQCASQICPALHESYGPSARGGWPDPSQLEMLPALC